MMLLCSIFTVVANSLCYSFVSLHLVSTLFLFYVNIYCVLNECYFSLCFHFIMYYYSKLQLPYNYILKYFHHPCIHLTVRASIYTHISVPIVQFGPVFLVSPPWHANSVYLCLRGETHRKTINFFCVQIFLTLQF